MDKIKSNLKKAFKEVMEFLSYCNDKYEKNGDIEHGQYEKGDWYK